jgi:hypothetical protein
MPYVPSEDRPALMVDRPPETAGELNYCITLLVDVFLDGAVNYDAINEVIGVLECAKLELYRRIAAPYEDKKIAENGDVYKHRSWMP